MSRPGICIFTETYYPVVGGGETQARVLAERLAQEGFPVTVLTRRSDPAFRRTERLDGVTVYRLPPPGRQHYRKWGLLITALPALVRLRREYDVLFVSGFRVVGLVSVVASHLLRKSCVLKADSLGEMSGRFFHAGLKKLGLRSSSFAVSAFLYVRNAVLRKADAFVSISSAVTQELIEAGISPAMIYSIPNSVDTGRFRPVSREEKLALRRRLGLPEDGSIVVYTGRLVSYKGLPLLLRVWRDVQARHARAHLLLVGGGGLDIHNCETELRAYVAESGLQRSVQFTGDVRNVHEYLQSADLFVFPTESEAFGISLIEAMACALPVISTPSGGVREILVHEQNGLVVQAGDFRQLRAALGRLLGDPFLAERLGRAARRHAAERYTVETVIWRYGKLFTHLARAAGKARHAGTRS